MASLKAKIAGSVLSPPGAPYLGLSLFWDSCSDYKMKAMGRQLWRGREASDDDIYKASKSSWAQTSWITASRQPKDIVLKVVYVIVPAFEEQLMASNILKGILCQMNFYCFC